MDKINFQNGVTKVNADIFNTLQNNIESAINDISSTTVIDNLTSTSTTDALSANQGKILNDKINGTVLYEDSVGTNGAISFNTQINVGELIEITYCRRRANGSSIYKTTGKIPYLLGMEIALDINYYSNESTLQSIAKLVVVSDSGIDVSGENTTVNGGTTVTNTIYVTKVVKYK